jgi:hypothetical protein
LNWATFLGFKNQIPLSFDITDDWAGVNTDSIKITMPTIYSGSDLLLTWYTYSWSDLQISLISWAVGTGNAWWYNVKFNPKRNLPSNTLITVTWVVLDLAGSTWYLNMSFTTRPSCAFWWCSEIFNVNIMNGSYSGIFDFSWSVLVVTWIDSKSPYPYLTWENMDVLMCGWPYTGTKLDSNIDIYDTNNNKINGLFYTWKELYITGMNFVIQDGVIIIQ